LELGFVITIEKGDLEAKTLLLVESIRHFGGALSDSAIWVVQPTIERDISSDTLRRLESLNVKYTKKALNRRLLGMRFANKAYSASFVEENAGDFPFLVHLDSDILCVNPPYDLLLPYGKRVGVAPVEVRNIGQSVGAPLSSYWKYVYETCNVSDSYLWGMKSRVDENEIYAYFNGGVIVEQRSLGLFHKWRSNLELLFDRAPFAKQSRSKEFFFLEQASLSATILGITKQDEVAILPVSHNYPGGYSNMPAKLRAKSLSEIALLHYHSTFYDNRWLKEFFVDENIQNWLVKRLPLLDLRKSLIQRNADLVVGKLQEYRPFLEKYRLLQNYRRMSGLLEKYKSR
jgi:hypothetical protein